MAITDEVLNELLKDYQKPEDLLGKDGLLNQMPGAWRACMDVGGRSVGTLSPAR